MTKLPSHHHLWSRASNSTRASILIRSRSAATAPGPRRTHRHQGGGGSEICQGGDGSGEQSRVVGPHHNRAFRTDGSTSASTSATTTTPSARHGSGGKRASVEDEAVYVVGNSNPHGAAAAPAAGSGSQAQAEADLPAPHIGPLLASPSLPTSAGPYLSFAEATASSSSSASSPSSSSLTSSSTTSIVYGPLTAEDALLTATSSGSTEPSSTYYNLPRGMPGSLTLHKRSQQLRTLWSSHSSKTIGSSISASSNGGQHSFYAVPGKWISTGTTALPFSTIVSLRAAASLLNTPYWSGMGAGSSNSAIGGSSTTSAHSLPDTMGDLASVGRLHLDHRTKPSSSALTLASPPSNASATLRLPHPDSLLAYPARRADDDVIASLAASIDTLLHLSSSLPSLSHQPLHQSRDRSVEILSAGQEPRNGPSATASSSKVKRPDARNDANGDDPHRNSRGSSSSSSSRSHSARPPSPRHQASSGRASPSFSPSAATSSAINSVNTNNQVAPAPSSTNHAAPFLLSSSRPTNTTTPHHSLSLDAPSSMVESRKSLTYSHQATEVPSTFQGFEFYHGAYGIPKRHPLAAPPSSRPKKDQTGSSSTGAPPRKGMLAAAADFLAGPQTTSPPSPPPAAPTASSSQAAAAISSSSQYRRPWKKLNPSTMRSVQVGEDSYFLRPDSIGIADGVGGWAARPGANPAMFSRLLMHFCSVELSRFDWIVDDPCFGHDKAQGSRGSDKEGRTNGTSGSARTDGLQSEREGSGNRRAALESHEHLDPVEVMHRAWERCVRVARREGILGSTTALLALLRGDELRIANLGDCVLLIVRKGELLFRSQEQQHSFNFPVQLGMMVRRGTRDVEDLVEVLFEDISKETAATSSGGNGESGESRKRKVGWSTASPSSSIRDIEGQDEDYDAPEDEALVREYTRRLDVISRRAAGLDQAAEEEKKASEREALKRRALFEGKSEEDFEAEMSAGEEFDFDVNTGSKSTISASGSGQDQSQKAGSQGEGEEDDEDEDRSTVYVGFDDSQPWDEPRRDCGRWTIKVQKGDIIIVASDGLVDNLFDDEIVEEVQRFAPPPPPPPLEDDRESHEDVEGRDKGTSAHAANSGIHPSPAYPPLDFSPQLLSEALASRAKAISQDARAVVSPFQQRATEEGLHYVGGKHDDISVLVAVVGEAGGANGGWGGGGGNNGKADNVGGSEGGEGGGLELRTR